MTTEHEASRTLVKSPPELWAECSDAGSLARHLGEFGEIRITKLEPESTVAWEGEHASGTVRIEPSGWGTRVTLTAQPKVEADEAPPEIEPSENVQPKSSEPEHQNDEEEDHAAVEETVEDPEELPVAETPRARARWRRITTRMRGFFRAAELGEPPDAEASGEPEQPEASVEPEKPEASGEPVEPGAEVRPETARGLETDAEPAPASELVAPEPPEPPEPAEPAEVPGIPAPEFDAEAILASALDSLGQAHHRPFSRA